MLNSFPDNDVAIFHYIFIFFSIQTKITIGIVFKQEGSYWYTIQKTSAEYMFLHTIMWVFSNIHSYFVCDAAVQLKKIFFTSNVFQVSEKHLIVVKDASDFNSNIWNNSVPLLNTHYNICIIYIGLHV